MRSRTGWMLTNGEVWKDDVASWLYESGSSEDEMVRVQVTELEQDCPKDYVQPGKKVVLPGEAEVLEVRSHPIADDRLGLWVQLVRGAPGGLFLAPYTKLKATSTRIKFSVMVEVGSAEEKALRAIAKTLEGKP